MYLIISQSSSSAFQFEDNRPEAIAQRKRQATADNSPQVAQLEAIQAMAIASSVPTIDLSEKPSGPTPPPVQRQKIASGLVIQQRRDKVRKVKNQRLGKN